ncbi:hypothetical protein PG988_011781 [Apiospora saccharicola]
MPNEEAGNIVGFCRYVNSSEAFERTAHERLIAVVHDFDSTGKSRGPRSPLTVTQLRDVLSVPRFKSNPHAPGAETGAIVAAPSLPPGQGRPERDNSYSSIEEVPNAERRLIIIANLDAWAAWVLIATVSPIQAMPLRSFLSDHITFKASFDVNITADGPPTFAMSFNLPFYALRDASKGSKRPEARGPRSNENIEFMRDFPQPNSKSSSSCEYIYQAKLSCLVTGHNSRVWSAYLFLDNYNDYEDGEIEENYNPDREALDQACFTLDPFEGRSLAWSQITPRESFLKILEVLSNQAKKEWCNTITNIVNIFDATRACYLKGLYSHGEEGRTRRQAYALWIGSVIKLLATLRRSLVECTNAWESFSAPGEDIGYFHNPGKHWDMKRRDRIRLNIIRKNFKQMSSMLGKLDMVNDELMHTTNELGRHLALENNQMAILQSETAMDVKILTWVTFHSLPFTLVAAFMSARAEILPWPETLATPIVSFLVIEAAIWIMVDVFSKGRYMAKIKGTATNLYARGSGAMRDIIGTQPINPTEV